MKIDIRKWIERFDREWAVKMVVIGAILAYLVSQFPYFYPFPEWTSILSAALLRGIGTPAIPYQHFLVVPNLPVLEISAECSGVVLMMIFPLIIFLIPGINIRHRLGSLLFLPILYFGNLLRIVLDVQLGLAYGTTALEFFHDTLGQVFIFLWAIIVYIVWLRIFGNFPRETRAIHPDGYD